MSNRALTLLQDELPISHRAPIDEAVVQEFFRVLQPAEIDALERVNAKQAAHQRELETHLGQEVRRLVYVASRAQRQYTAWTRRTG
jgi:hypothetical protein